jgi:hypothetical protein
MKRHQPMAGAGANRASHSDHPNPATIVID